MKKNALDVIRHPIASGFIASWLKKNPVLGFYTPGNSEVTPDYVRWFWIVKTARKISKYPPDHLFGWAGEIASSQSSRLIRFPFFTAEEEGNIPGSNRRYARDKGGFVGLIKDKVAYVVIEYIRYRKEEDRNPNSFIDERLLTYYEEIASLLEAIYSYDDEPQYESIKKELEALYEKGTIERPEEPLARRIREAELLLRHSFDFVGSPNIKKVGCRRYALQGVEDSVFDLTITNTHSGVEYAGVGLNEDHQWVSELQDAKMGVCDWGEGPHIFYRIS